MSLLYLLGTTNPDCNNNNYYIGGNLSGTSRINLSTANADGGCLEFNPTVKDNASYQIGSVDLDGVSITGVSATSASNTTIN